MTTHFLVIDSTTDVVRWEDSSLSGTDYYYVCDRSTGVVSWQLASDASPPANLSTLIIDDGTDVISWQNYS
jgi:hypothetical protein